MARGISPAARAAAAAKVVRVASFVSMDLRGGMWRTWSGTGPIDFGAGVYAGTGSMVQIAVPSESADLTAHPASITVAAVPADMLQRVLFEKLKNRTATVSFGYFDGEGALIETPRVFTRFRLNVPTIDEQSGTITVSGESKLRDLRRAQAVLYSTETQKTFFPGTPDRAFEYIPTIADAHVYHGDGDPE